ncbi:uncharacterized protein LOC143551267 [Bidens hawaiensis]|uniref:uncharacterized protein LOC143551267 n=1 Tax=Bidens hawaiensis TaxID=980011 RepID=UPI00404B2C97
MLALFPSEEVEYRSSDSLAECENVSDDFDPHLYSPDLLNGLKMSGMPNHRLVLKVGVPIMLLRNINHKKGLCNGTRLQVFSIGRRVIEAKVVSFTNIGYHTLISRVSLTPSEKKLPFKLKRRQFPISVCFAMTINKIHGQSLSRVGLYLKDPAFSHGQLYVALSRVKSRDGIKLVILDKDSKLTNKTTNVVYKKIFGNNGQYKNLKPKILLSCDDLILLKELDMLKLSNARKEIAHLELEGEMSLKVKWLAECANYESDFDDFPENLESDDEV